MKRILVLFCVLCFITGCGSGKVQLGGTVTYEDGTPLTMGSVVFATDSYQARGDIDSDGKFVMGSIDVKDGLPKGTYKVYISGAMEEVSGKGGVTAWSLIDPQYGGYASTPLTCDIPAPGNTFDIKVPRNPQPKP